jgi:hypothetical protein
MSGMVFVVFFGIVLAGVSESTGYDMNSLYLERIRERVVRIHFWYVASEILLSLRKDVKYRHINLSILNSDKTVVAVLSACTLLHDFPTSHVSRSTDSSSVAGPGSTTNDRDHV